MPVKLHTSLKASYGDKSSLEKLKKKGYEKDKELSNGNQQIFVKHKKNGKVKLLNTVAGTHNASDWMTDLYLGAGHLKDTNRYKEAKSTLEKAKKKYHPDDVTITGHSLGGSIASYIGGRKDKVLTLDKGATLFQHTRKNEKAYRSSGDLVSALNANAKHTKTINQKGGLLGTYSHTLSGLLSMNPLASAFGFAHDVLKAHDVDNVKKEKIFV